MGTPQDATTVFVLLVAYLQASTPRPTSRSMAAFHLLESTLTVEQRPLDICPSHRCPGLSFCFYMFISIICLNARATNAFPCLPLCP